MLKLLLDEHISPEVLSNLVFACNKTATQDISAETGATALALKLIEATGGKTDIRLGIEAAAKQQHDFPYRQGASLDIGLSACR